MTGLLAMFAVDHTYTYNCAMTLLETLPRTNYIVVFRENDTDGDFNTPESQLWWETAGRGGFFYLIPSVISVGPVS